MTQPDEILVVWDGPNGSAKRKALIKAIKEVETTKVESLSSQSTDDQIVMNKIWQQSRVVDYFNEMPIGN